MNTLHLRPLSFLLHAVFLLTAPLLISVPVVVNAAVANDLPGLVSMRRTMDTTILEAIQSNCTFDGGTIVFGGPSSLEQDDKYYFLSHRQLLAYQLVVDTVNRERCGVRIGGKNYKIDLVSIDDQSSPDIAAAVGHKLVQAPYSNNSANNMLQQQDAIDLIVSCFSSALTRPLADVVAAHNINASLPSGNSNNNKQLRLMLAGGSSVTSIFQNRSNIFTTTPPVANFLRPAMQGLSQETTAKTVATLWEEVGFARSACGAVPGLAQEFYMELVSENAVEASPNTTVLDPVATHLKAINPDVVIACMYECDRWMQAIRKVNWTPKAQVFTVCVGRDDFVASVGSDAEYVMGVAPWHESVRATDALTGWTSQEFTQHYSALSSDPAVVYQATTAAAMISIAVQAMEAVDSYKDVPLLSDYLSRNTFPTMFGDISFDENGQNAADMLLLQHDETGEVQTTFPRDKSSGPILYPMPTWDGRDCLHLSDCVKRYGYTCSREGHCICPQTQPNGNGPTLTSVGVGSTATCVSVTAFSSGNVNPGVTVGIVVAILATLGVVYWVITEEKRKKTDSVWKVDKKELDFGDPPQVVGRGSFGVVLLASYRGTEVAVKRVIPPKDMDNKSNSNNGSKDEVPQSCDDNNSEDGEKEPGAEETEKTGDMGRASTNSWGVLSFGITTNDSGFSMNPKTNESFAGVDGLQAGNPLHSAASGKKNGRKRNARAERRRLERDFLNEMRILSKLRHPCITTVMGAVLNKGEEPLLVMEYMDHGSLHDILHNNTMILEGETILPILRDISQGMRFLHATNILHKDLKAANILIDSKFHAKITDFGLSKGNMAVGTPYFMAPELLRGQSTNTAASDVYAFGIILYEVFSRKNPYEGENPKEVLKLVADQKVKKRPPVPKDCPPLIEGLMSDCQMEQPLERPTFEEVDVRLKRMDITKIKTGANFNVRSSQISLFDIFPKHVAEALRDGRQVDSEHKDCVTIFFSDIVGFTQLSATLEPRKVANMLDRLYTKFDQLSHKEDVFKVETIGDAYMAVSNLLKDQDHDHVVRIARFAAGAIAAAKETLIDLDNPDRGYVTIRCGFHSGPVVADVVGSRNPRYCLFGDSVNTASRMESTSKPNRIHCSQRSAALLKEQDSTIRMRCRGFVDVKGKGKMETFWVQSADNSGAFTNSAAFSNSGGLSEMFSSPFHDDSERVDDERPSHAEGEQTKEQHPEGGTAAPEVFDNE